MGTGKSQLRSAVVKPPSQDKLEFDRPGTLAERRAKIKAAIAANREILRRLSK
jgi:hypothetical protein